MRAEQMRKLLTFMCQKNANVLGKTYGHGYTFAPLPNEPLQNAVELYCSGIDITKLVCKFYIRCK